MTNGPALEMRTGPPWGMRVSATGTTAPLNLLHFPREVADRASGLPVDPVEVHVAVDKRGRAGLRVGAVEPALEAVGLLRGEDPLGPQSLLREDADTGGDAALVEVLDKATLRVAAGPVVASRKRAVALQGVLHRGDNVRHRVPDVIDEATVTVGRERGINDLH